MQQEPLDSFEVWIFTGAIGVIVGLIIYFVSWNQFNAVTFGWCTAYALHRAIMYQQRVGR